MELRMIENFLHFGAKLYALSAKAEKPRCFRAYEQRDPSDRTVSHCAITLDYVEIRWGVFALSANHP